MKAVQISSYGDRPVVVEVDRPRPGPGEVVVRVAGAALNPLDLKIAGGSMHDYFPVELPYTLGTDISGTLASTGRTRAGWEVGDRVVERLDPRRGGAFAEEVVVPVDQLVAAPRSLPWPMPRASSRRRRRRRRRGRRSPRSQASGRVRRSSSTRAQGASGPSPSSSLARWVRT